MDIYNDDSMEFNGMLPNRPDDLVGANAEVFLWITGCEARQGGKEQSFGEFKGFYDEVIGPMTHRMGSNR